MHFIRIWFCVSVLNLISLWCIAQPALHKKVELWAGPNYSYRNLKGSGTTTPFVIDFRNKTEKPIAGIEAGISIYHSISYDFAITFGLQFSEVGEKTLPSFLVFDSLLIDTVGSIRFQRHYQSLEVPFAISYSILKGNLKIEPYVGVGFAKFFNDHSTSKIDYFNGHTDTTVVTNSGKVDGTNSFTGINLFGTFQARINYRLNRQTEMFIEPGVKYYFVPMVQDASIKEYNYCGRVVVGISFIGDLYRR